jgi:hypothetical protein
MVLWCTMSTATCRGGGGVSTRPRPAALRARRAATAPPLHLILALVVRHDVAVLDLHDAINHAA